MTLQKQLTVFCAAMLLAAATLTAQQPKIDLRHAGGSTIFTDMPAAVSGFRH